MNIRPLGNRLVVRRWPEIEQAESGLWLPAVAREKPQLGDVLAVGPGQRLKYPIDLDDCPDYLTHYPPDINVGDIVVFQKMVSRDYEWRIDGEPILILPYSTIYAVISGLAIAK